MEAVKNPPWTRDELILALDLYFKHPPSAISHNHPEVEALSSILNRMAVHTLKPDKEKFRNPNSIYMKMCNFLRLDPNYRGSGLLRGGKLEEEIWNEFANDRGRLHLVAQQIIKGINESDAQTAQEGEEEFPEGRILFRLHKARERSSRLTVKAKQLAFEQSGILSCTVCGFNFEKVYGEIGRGFIECHHIIPVSELEIGSKTRVQDLVLVCSNCHRMLHRRRPWLTVDKLKRLLHSGQIS